MAQTICKHSLKAILNNRRTLVSPVFGLEYGTVIWIHRTIRLFVCEFQLVGESQWAKA